ncbi:CRP/FNR family transcriptional regulator, anaerobic regulatory protein [Humidesulfovibrio mexicanus]|uniref:CRP/FNR family transcriptional regulator, anaerobic regulatory protein n=2 Tax=Humidesulfovibrio mexicanus TaxID=147047 RepID=A0A238Y623_9BACT|nr:CRP/FNR family transcriptional regulator, anaerobic regulatory protein [Humidesulfovibrio mexicanus]
MGKNGGHGRTTVSADELEAIPLFASLSEAQRERIAQEASVESIAVGGLYFSERTASTGFHILLSGRVKLFKVAEDGKEQTIYIFGPGEPFCLCSEFSDGQLPANLTALESSRVLVLAPQPFERLSQKDPAILLALLRIVSRRLKEAMEMIDALSLKQIPSRIAAYLLTHAQGESIRLGITHREFSKIIGVTPEALSRTLTKMTKSGLIKQGDGEIRIIERRLLEDCRDGSCAVVTKE